MSAEGLSEMTDAETVEAVCRMLDDSLAGASEQHRSELLFQLGLLSALRGITHALQDLTTSYDVANEVQRG